MKTYLAIIPARGGSKGITDKNIVPVNNLPLIAYSIKPGLELVKRNIIDTLIVSTDSFSIASIARDFRAEVPFLRPSIIAADNSKSYEFVLHALDFYQAMNKQFDAVIILQPTNPLREEVDIENCISLFEQHQADSLISCYLEEYINERVQYAKEGDFALPRSPQHNQGMRRQEHEKLYIRNGAVYITSVSYVRSTTRIISDKPLMYIMPKSKSINLDTMDDLELLRKILR